MNQPPRDYAPPTSSQSFALVPRRFERLRHWAETWPGDVIGFAAVILLITVALHAEWLIDVCL